MDIIKKRVVTEIMKTSVADAHIEEIITTLSEDGTWPDIDYKDVSREGFQHRVHADNMLDLARAYKTRSSKFHKSKKVKRAIERALQHWIANDYICDNWWYNQIGIPNTMVALMLLIGEELPQNLVNGTQPIIGRAHINAQGARPGGDRIKIAGIEAKNMLFLGNKVHFGKIISVIEGEIKKVEWIGMRYGYGYRDGEGGFENRTEGGRGIQYDNSFHHRNDGVNNTLSYGLGYANAFIEWAIYTAATPYFFSNEKIEILIDYFLDGICKTAIYGKFPDPGAKNRSISRPGTLRPYSSKMPEQLLALSDYRSEELHEIVAIRNTAGRPTSSHATFYRHTEHFSFQRPDFFTSVRMHSTRTHNMEYPYNSEGLLNHHRGDGANHISVSGDEYYDIWPVYDYQKIPGTTSVQKPEMPSPESVRVLGVTDFVGAVTDDKYAAVAFDFKRQADTLAARKSWFFFDKAYVCLGVGIATDWEMPVFTTINQALLRGPVTVKSENSVLKAEKGQTSFKDVDWVFHDGVGYLFPSPTTVYLKNKKETGSWWRINKQAHSSKEKIALDVFALWLDHGVQPKNGTYEYMVVPATSLERLGQRNDNNTISILANTPYIQAVGNTKLGIYQTVFYKAGKIDLTDNLTLTSDTPGMVMIELQGDRLEAVSVADPNRELGKMHLFVNTPLDKIGDNYRAQWNKDEKHTEIRIVLPQGMDAGKSVTLRF
ncbi:MAG: polysaccharide lyase family 8 super-sandwich domain-containing protein [Bacteroidota bacterium]